MDINGEINNVNRAQQAMLEQKDAAMAALASDNEELKQELSRARNLLARIASTEPTGIEGLLHRVRHL